MAAHHTTSRVAPSKAEGMKASSQWKVKCGEDDCCASGTPSTLTGGSVEMVVAVVSIKPSGLATVVTVLNVEAIVGERRTAERRA
eukprot:SAG11_NODE_1247_length_5401_cov_2.372878_12_plen_85_part_00